MNLHDQIVDNIPVYLKKILSVIGAVIFTASVLYLLHIMSISHRSAYFAEIGAPNFIQPINLWSFYTFNVHLLFICILSLIFFVGFYVLGWLGMLSHKKTNIYEYVFYNFVVGLVVFSFVLVEQKYTWWIYVISILLFVIFMTTVQYQDDKNKNRGIDGNKEPKRIKDKLILYFVLLFAIPYLIFFPAIGIFAFNAFVGTEYGKSGGKDLVKLIKSNEYIDKNGAAIIKSSGEYIYTLNCGESSCLIIRKNEKNTLLFEFIDSKDIVFITHL